MRNILGFVKRNNVWILAVVLVSLIIYKSQDSTKPEVVIDYSWNLVDGAYQLRLERSDLSGEQNNLSFEVLNDLGPLELQAIVETEGGLALPATHYPPAGLTKFEWRGNIGAIQVSYAPETVAGVGGASIRPKSWRVFGVPEEGIAFIPAGASGIKSNSGVATRLKPKESTQEPRFFTSGSWKVQESDQVTILGDPGLSSVELERCKGAFLDMLECARGIVPDLLTDEAIVVVCCAYEFRASEMAIVNGEGSGHIFVVEHGTRLGLTQCANSLADLVIARISKTRNISERAVWDSARVPLRELLLTSSGLDIQFLVAARRRVAESLWRGFQLEPGREIRADYFERSIASPYFWDEWRSELDMVGSPPGADPLAAFLKAIAAPLNADMEIGSILSGLGAEGSALAAWSAANSRFEGEELVSVPSGHFVHDLQRYKDVNLVSDSELMPRLSIVGSSRNAGHINNCGCFAGKLGGICRRETLLDLLQTSSENRLLLELGDFLADPYSEHPRSLEEAKLVATSMEDSGYHVAIPGSAELSLSTESLASIRAETTFEWVCSNVSALKGPGFSRYTDVLCGNQQVRVFGLYEPLIASQRHDSLERSLLQNYRVSDVLTTMNQLADEIVNAPGLVVLAGSITPESLAKLCGTEWWSSVDVCITSNDALPRLTSGPQIGHKNDGKLPSGYYASVPCAVLHEGLFSMTVVELATQSDQSFYSMVPIRIETGIRGNRACMEKINKVMISMNEEIISRGGPLDSLAEEASNQSAYVGSNSCRGCHPREYADWANSPHAKAMTTLVERGADARGDCVQCHVVGFGKPTGAWGGVDLASEESLYGVGCETCHGPGSLHLAQRDRESIRGSFSADKCALCHTEEHSGEFHSLKKYLLGPHTLLPE